MGFNIEATIQSDWWMWSFWGHPTTEHTWNILLAQHFACLRMDEAQVLVAALSHCRRLMELNLASNVLGDAGIRAIAILMAKSTSLVNLNIANNDIGDLGAEDVVMALEKNASLQKLCLDWNGITRADKLGEVLGTHTKLQELYLSGNHLQNEGVKQLCTGLSKNTVLQKLDLALNFIHEEGMAHLKEVMQTNTTITVLDISRNYLTDSFTASVNHLVQRNVDERQRRGE